MASCLWIALITLNGCCSRQPIDNQKVQEPTDGLASMSYAKDGATLAIATFHQNTSGPDPEYQACDIKFCDPRTGILRGYFATEGSRINKIAFSPTDALLASATSNDGLNFYRPPATNKIQMNRRAGKVTCVAFSRDGTAWACGYSDGFIQTATLYSAPVPWKAYAGRVSSVAFLETPTGSFVASASSSFNEAAVALWDPATGLSARSFTTALRNITAICFSADGMYLASGAENGTIALNQVGTGQQLWATSGENNDGDVTCIAFHPRGKFIASGTREKLDSQRTQHDISIRSLEDQGKLLEKLPAFRGGITCIAFLPPDGNRIAVGGFYYPLPLVMESPSKSW